ncbi:MAG TPA: hypothetical protein VIK74_10680 [Parasegetibacter sp.]
MNTKIFLAGLILAGSFSACSTAYKAGQTPDDVYYSPAKEQNGYVVMEKNNQRNHYEGDRYYGATGYNNYYNDFDDRYLRLMVRNKYRYGTGFYGFDDLYFSNFYYNPYAFGNYNSYNNWYSPWNPYWSWNSYYNPYAPSPIFVIPGKGSGIDYTKRETFRPRPFNINSYTSNNTRVNGQSNNSGNTYRPTRGYNNSNNNVNSTNSSNNGFGGLMKKVLSSDRNNNNGYQTSQGNTQNRPTRVYNPTTNNTNRSNNTSTNSEMGSSGSNSNRSSGSNSNNNNGGGGVSRPNRNRN